MIQIFICQVYEVNPIILITNLQDDVDAFVNKHKDKQITIETYETEKPFSRMIGEE